jgi:tetratricopeptide (TPR) repeat protein
MIRLYILLAFLVAFFSISAAEDSEIERLMQEGIELHSEGNFYRAIEKYNEVLRLDPENIAAIYEIALSYLALGNYENAIRYAANVINSLDPALSVGAYAIQSEALAALDRTEEAIALLESALAIRGNEYLLHFNLALNHYKLNNLENSLVHVRKAIDLDKTHAEAFLLYAYILNDKELWVRSILAFQMFLLLEPDDHRSRTAFEELLYTMRLISLNEDEEGRPAALSQNPPLTIIKGVNRFLIYNTIAATLQSLRENSEEEEYDLFLKFKSVNREIILQLNEKNDGSEERMDNFWTFYVPFFTRIVESEHYETFARYISVSYFPESLEWWQNHPEYAELFVIWFEEGDAEYYDTDVPEYDVESNIADDEPSVYEPIVVPENRPNFFRRIISNLRSQPIEENGENRADERDDELPVEEIGENGREW